MTDEELTGFLEQARVASKAELTEIVSILVDRVRKADAQRRATTDELANAARPFLGPLYQGLIGSTFYKNQSGLDFALRLYEKFK